MSDVIVLENDNIVVNVQDDNTITVILVADYIASGGGGGSSAWGGITGTLSDQTDLQNALDLKADITSIPDQLSDLTDDSTHRTVTDAEKITWNAKQNSLGFTPVPDTRTINGYDLTANRTLTKGDIGLGNVDNTSDANKPISTATQTALNLKADISSLATVATSGAYADLSGKPTIPDELADLTQDSTHRTVTDAEKTTWNNKLDGISLSTQTIDFGSEKNQTNVVVVDATVTANTIINIRHASEDLALQSINFYVVKNIGVGYTIFGVAPNGASGQYSIQIEKLEGE